MKEIALQYVNMLFGMLQYDIGILSQKWMIFTVVPAVFYLVFSLSNGQFLRLPYGCP
jgi:hypothetical protein